MLDALFAFCVGGCSCHAMSTANSDRKVALVKVTRRRLPESGPGVGLLSHNKQGFSIAGKIVSEIVVLFVHISVKGNNQMLARYCGRRGTYPRWHSFKERIKSI